MDLTDTTYRRIADEFTGDGSLEIYKYKTGPKLVSLFNSYFNFNDVYESGFSSRWYYVSENIKKIGIVPFFQVILSSKYLRLEEGYIRNNVNDAILEALIKFNEILDPEDIKIVRDENQILIQEIVDSELIGQGGFAKVYLNRQSNRVIKVLNHILRKDSSASTRFKREFEITHSLNDISGIMKVHTFDPQKMQYEMDYCELTLENYRPYESSDDTKRKIIGDFLLIMSIVHSRKVMHRDLTPNNIFIENEHVIIGDFGLGKDLTANYSRYTHETKGVGQFNYIAPEQEAGLQNASFEADVYSIGKIMNFILTGSPRDYNHEFKYLTQKATAQDPQIRFRNAMEFSEAYNNFLNQKNEAEVLGNLEIDIITGQYSEKTNIYLSQLSSEEISDKLAKTEVYAQAILFLLESRPEFSNDILLRLLDGITKGYQWNSYDHFSKVAYLVLISPVSFPYDTRVSAARLLSYIAYDVNRFHAQNLIKEIKNRGIEPTIQEILDRN